MGDFESYRQKSYQEMKKAEYPLDPEGFGQFYSDSVSVLVASFIKRGYKNPELEDAAQEVYLDLYERLENIRVEESGNFLGAPVFGWLTQALGWKMHNYHRRSVNSQGTRRMITLEAGLVGSSGFKGVDEKIIVNEALSQLPRRDRVFFGMTMDGYSRPEIARAIDVEDAKMPNVSAMAFKHLRLVVDGAELPKVGRPPVKK